MDSQRWKRIDSLLHAALDRPPAGRAEFLHEACAGDQALEREVLSLLASDREAGSFLDGPVLPAMASERWRDVQELYHAARERGRGVLTDADPEIRREVEELLEQDPTITHLAGQTVSHYAILEMLGAGGMGVVYKAFDTKLDRHVALKFLPPHLRHNQDLKQRLKEEARAASTLDHANIVVIYEIDETPGGDLFIAMAFHEGVTVRDRIAREPAGMPVAEALQIARQIAAGLAKAHERGILHRDIKPGNVIVAQDGVARIIDFGLAKSTEATATLDGATKGTPLYMSPEQASGKPLDCRTDLWSLGVVLYEMLAGRTPFTGEGHLPILRAIVDDAPPKLRELRPDVPPEVDRIVRRALEKDPAQRYQSAAEMVRDLSAALGLDTGSARMAVGTAPGIGRRALYACATLAALLAGAFLAWRFGPSRQPVTSASEYIQITNFNDSATAPALSPDGRMVTFFRGGGYFLGQGQVYVKFLPDGESRQLTFDSGVKYGPVFTPDASRVAYTALAVAAGRFDTWTVPVLGGPPTRLMVNAAGLGWIGPDRVLFSEIMAGSMMHMGIVTAKESRADERRIYFPAHVDAMAHYSWLSPNRDWVLVVEMNGGVTNWQRCRVVPMDGSSPGVPVGPRGACTAAAWSPDGRWMYLNVKVDGSTHLWRQRWDGRAPRGNPEQITLGPTEEEGLAVAADGKSLIASVGVRQSSVWTHDAAGNHAVSLEGSASSPWLSADGKRLYYLLRKNSLSDVSELWRRDLQSGKSDPVLTGQRIVDYEVSRDEAKVAFTVHVGDESQIFLAAADRSSPPRLVVRGGDEVTFGAGQLFFRQVEGNADYLARVQEDGSGFARIPETKTTQIGGVSPDGEWAIIEDIQGAAGGYVVGVRRRAQRKICPGVCFMQWSADGKYLYLSAVSRFSPSESTQPTYVIPIPHGVERLDLPASGIDLTNKEQLAGLQSIPPGNMSPGPDPQTYAFTITAFQGNLFRIPLH